jgi:Signal transduction histidine kinase
MKNTLSLILFIVCFPLVGLSAKKGIPFDNYSVTYFSSQDGIEDGLVNDIIQDHKGLLWFATWNGLCRFDGYSFKNYKSDAEEKKGLVNNRLLYITEDKYGCIWVQCYDSACYRFNPNTEIFEPIPKESSNKIQSVEILSNGSVWLLCKDGGGIRVLTDFDDLSLSYNTYSYPEGTLPRGKIQSVFVDSKSHEWILTDNGLYRLVDSQLLTIVQGNAKGGGNTAFHAAQERNGELFFGAGLGKVYQFSLIRDQLDSCQLSTTASVISILEVSSKMIYTTDEDGFFIHNSSNDIKHVTLEVNKTIESAQVTKNELLWFVHPGYGASLFDMQTQQLSFVEIKDESGRPLTTESGFFTIEDENDVLWVHPKGGGFSYYDVQSKQLVPFNTTNRSVKWKSNDRCFAALADKQGNLWMSTQQDRLKRITFVPDKFHIYSPAPEDTELPGNEIRALYFDRAGRLWTGGKGADVSVYDKQLNLLQRFKIGKVYAITQDADSAYWISTKGDGLVRVTEMANGKFNIQRFANNPNDPFSLSSDNLYYTFQDSKKRIWIATYGGGLNLVENNPDGSVRFISHRNLMKNYPIDRFYKVRHVTEDMQGRIWASTTAGILLFDNAYQNPGDIVFHSICWEQGNSNSLSNNDVQMVKHMSDGGIYAITYGGGLNELVQTGDYSFDSKVYARKNGLISDIIYSMQEDREGNIWMASAGGIVKFITEGEQVQYPIEHIAPNVHFSEGVGATDGKQIFFGTNRGLFYFTPEAIRKTDFIPPIFFSSIWVNNQEQSSKQESSAFTNSLDNSCCITLPSNNHSLRIDFSALDMTDTKYIQYTYMLEGFDKTYHQTDRNEANYTNLPPGKYVFHVKSTNNEGVWVENERTLSIEVLPTFHETLYSKLLYIVLVLLLIACAIYIYTVFYRIRNKAKNEELISRMKMDFFTNVSHELRTPLTLVTGPLEFILQGKCKPENVKGILDNVKKNCDRMQRLVGQILDFSKIQDNKMKLRILRKDIVGFTSNIVNYFTALAQKRNINLTFVSDSSYCYLWFDMDHIEKAVFNLISNAFKYTADGKNIQVRIIEKENSVVIQIKDEGTGIKKEKQVVIFNRFENLKQTNMQFSLSSGIGLSLAKELVEMHQGNITLESEPGEGSAFSIELLKGKAHFPNDTEYILSDWEEETSMLLSEEERHTKNSTDDKLLMLVIEDNYELRMFIRQIFQDKFHIIEARDGKEGVEKAFSDLPDIIITDIMMPVKDGIGVLKELRNDERTSHIPAIVLTAKADQGSILTGIQTGADDYVTKPFSVDYLQAKVNHILEQRTILQEYYRNTQYAVVQEDVQNEQDLPQLSEKDIIFLNKLSEVMNLQMDNPDLSVDQMVSYFNLSRTNFFQKLKSLTGLSPILYIKESRMRKAAELLKGKDYSVSEIAYKVGFSDPSYFSKCFKSFWNMTSTEYAKKQTGR